MWEVLWMAVFIGVLATGIAIVAARPSRLWVAAGCGYALGATGFIVWYVIALTRAFDPPIQFTAADVAAYFGALGFMALLVAAVLTLVAAGSRGRRYFIVVFAVM